MAKKREQEADLAAREAKRGQKMIEIKLRFWTEDIAPKDGEVLPKHAWAGGEIRAESNAAHGIKSKPARIFNSMLEVGAAIEKVIIDNGIVLHPSRKEQKYIRAGKTERP